MKKRIRITNSVLPPRALPDIRPYNIIENDDDSAEIIMYGEVVESVPIDWWTGEPVDGLYIVLSDFLKDISALKSKNKVTVRINSIGGDLEAGVAIYNRLKEMSNVTTITDALAASAASIIFQAGSVRQVYSASQVMAHGASVMMYGSYNLQDLDLVRERVDAANKQVIAIYEETTGQSRTQLKHLVEKTTWMTGQEIIDQGFADEMISGKDVTMSMSADRSVFLCNGVPMNYKKFISIPNNVTVMPKTKKQTATADAYNQNIPEGGNNMTLEEMRAQHPELVKQIEDAAKATVKADTSVVENAAVNAERQRIQEIESIENSIADKELVKNAKYGDKPMSAQELAFQAMQKQAQLGNQFLSDNKKDTQNSGAAGVQSTPNGGEIKNKDQEEAADIMAAVNAAKQIRGGK